MPIVIETLCSDSIELGDLVQYLNDEKVDTSDHDAMIAAGPMLKRLANNRHFLADMALEELKSRNGLNPGANSYSPQVIMLYPPKSATQNFFLRANIWPSPQDHIFISSGAEQFFYHNPHDHSFNFVTVGYYGPGYRSNYYEYDYSEVAGYPGEEVPLRFVENSALDEGKVMLYRACIDIHDQLPGESMSISLNIMENNLSASVYDQYSFNVGNSTVTDLINRVPSAALLPLIAQGGDGNAADFLSETAKHHPMGRVRCSALAALAGAQPDIPSAITIYEEGMSSDLEMVRGWSAFQSEKLTAFSKAG